MYEPRFPRPNYGQQPPQWRPHNARFRPRWHMPPRFMPPQIASRPPYSSHNQEEEFWCETCDRGFQTKQLLENHNQQHQKCNIDGCQFIAHPKVITKHIQMQHSTGLFKKISKLDNPEEIKKWREERKKRYPTKDNVDKKIAEIKEKVERGEKMGMTYNRGNRYNKTEYGMKRKHSNEQNHRHHVKRPFQGNNTSKEMKNSKNYMEPKQKPPPRRECPITVPVEEGPKLKPFTGIQNILEENDSDNDIKENNTCLIDDDYYLGEESSVINNCPPVKPSVCGALTSLISSYGSSDDEPSETAEVKNDTQGTSKLQTNLIKFDQNDIASKPIQLTNINNNDSKDKQESDVEKDSKDKQESNVEKHSKDKQDIEKDSKDKQDSGDNDAPEEMKTIKASDVQCSADISQSNIRKIKQTTIKNPKITAGKNIRNENAFNRNNPQKFKAKIPSTLLEKLLSKEIRQERNIILQCIRHIVKNNYFEKTEVETK